MSFFVNETWVRHTEFMQHPSRNNVKAHTDPRSEKDVDLIAINWP